MRRYCQNSLRRCCCCCPLHRVTIAQTLTRPGGNSSQGTTMCSSSTNEGSSGGTCKEGSVLRWKLGQIMLPAPELPPPTNWGWSWTGEGQYTLYLTRLPEAAHSCIELVSCKCKKGCVRRCSCEKATLQCRALLIVKGTARDGDSTTYMHLCQF